MLIKTVSANLSIYTVIPSIPLISVYLYRTSFNIFGICIFIPSFLQYLWYLDINCGSIESPVIAYNKQLVKRNLRVLFDFCPFTRENELSFR